jgi:hypothetical protein
MGFSVPQFELGKEHREQPGRDMIPPDPRYKPTINLHGNHSNLEHDYDPRHDLPEIIIAESEDPANVRRRSYAVPVTMAFLILLIAALIALPLLIQ